MDTIKNSHCCPVCGYNLDFMPWKGISASDEICPCCGIQYGYDDAAGGDVSKRNSIYKEWQNHWIKEGMPWKSMGIDPPENWDPVKQLKNISHNEHTPNVGIMNKQRIGEELKLQLEKGYDIVKISRWAYKLFDENCCALDPPSREILQCLFSMEDDPQFEYAENELRLLAEKLISNEEDPLKQINDLKSKGAT